ncbi:hypothetical protein CC79DRAFT_908881 [Sarocladium strictum]
MCGRGWSRVGWENVPVVNLSMSLSQPRSVFGECAQMSPGTNGSPPFGFMALFCLASALLLVTFEAVVVVAASLFGYGTPRLGTTPLRSTKNWDHAPNKTINLPTSSSEPPSDHLNSCSVTSVSLRSCFPGSRTCRSTQHHPCYAHHAAPNG